MYLRAPCLDRFYRQSTRRRISVLAPLNVTTSDGVALTIGLLLGFEIRDLLALYERLHDANDTIDAQVSSMVSSFVSSTAYADVSPATIEAHGKESLNLSLYGLDDVDLRVSHFVAVRTYRFITGEATAWSRADAVETLREVAGGGVR